METLIKKVVDVKPGETRALLWSFFYFFFLLASYYVLRPLRDEMGAALGVTRLPSLFLATFLVLLPAAPVLAALVKKLPRSRFVPIIYQFFAVNILVFWALLTFKIHPQTVMKVYFVWVSVANVFVVSVFWSFMADLYQSDQSKRLYAFIGAGGSLGTLFAPMFVKFAVDYIGAFNMLLAAFFLLQGAILCARALERVSVASDSTVGTGAKAARGQAVGGGLLDGFMQIFRSRYLAGIAAWVFLLSVANTVLYFQQNELVRAFSDDPSQRLKIFANIDLWASLLTILMQVFATGRLVSRFGTGPAAAVLPLVFALGFLVLAVHPLLVVVTVFQALQRAANFGIANPARESFWTVVSRDEKFKSKNVVDGAVFRAADAANAYFTAFLRSFGSLAAVAWIAAAVSAAWLVLSLGLGRGQEKRARDSAGAK